MSKTGTAFGVFTAYAYSVLLVGSLLVATTLSPIAYLPLVLAIAAGIYMVIMMLRV